jgi:hypothetical protein
MKAMKLSSRRELGLGLLVLFSGALIFVDYALTSHLRRAALFSGATLLALVLFLTLFNARKKLPFLPLLRASTWMQFHIYAGYLSVILFGIHTRWRIPHGSLETILALLFLAVAASGVFGIFISRWIPPRLAVYGQTVIFERIPAMRVEMRRKAEELVVESVAATHSSTLADFYERKLRDFFARPQSIRQHLMGNRKPMFNLLSELEGLDRYLNAREREVVADLTDLIRTKDNLDYQLAGQGALKAWLFVHIPLTYALILIAFGHAILAWSFS